MILVDPQLDFSRAEDVLNHGSAKPAAGSVAALNREPPAKSLRPPSTRTLTRFLADAQAAVRLRGHVTVLLTNDATMRDLNRRFRGKNKPTDVLSFPAAEPVQRQKKNQKKNEENGDLAIGVETALRQAAEQGHSLAVEIEVLILHGVLHLAGYDHEADTGQMQRRERSLRARLGLPQGLIERASPGQSTRPKPRPATSGRSTAGAASRRDARKLAPDGVWRGTRRTQSGESRLNSRKPRRGAGNAPARAARSVKP
jgi:probable rRNA maturation factor